MIEEENSREKDIPERRTAVMSKLFDWSIAQLFVCATAKADAKKIKLALLGTRAIELTGEVSEDAPSNYVEVIYGAFIYYFGQHDNWIKVI